MAGPPGLEPAFAPQVLNYGGQVGNQAIMRANLGMGRKWAGAGWNRRWARFGTRVGTGTAQKLTGSRGSAERLSKA